MKPFITNAFRDGKFVLPFQIEGLPQDRLIEPFEGAFVLAYGLSESQSFQATWLFRLALSTGWIVDFSSACTEVGDWKEVGSLNLRFAQDMKEGDRSLSSLTPMPYFQIKGIDRLIYEDASVYAECGIVLSDLLGGDLVVAAGVAPGSVSISCPLSEDGFHPEFSMGQYRRQQIMGSGLSL